MSAFEPRKNLVVTIPQGWLAVVVASVIAAVTPWLVLQAFALLAYLGQVSNVWLAGASWSDSALVATSAWALGYLTPIQFASFQLTLVPLGLSLLYLLVLISALRVWQPTNPQAIWFAIPAYALTCLILASGGGSYVSAVKVALAGAAFALIACCWRELARPQEEYPMPAAMQRLKNWDSSISVENPRPGRELALPGKTLMLPGWAVDGVAASVRIWAGLAGASLVVALVCFYQNWQRISEITEILGVGGWESVLAWIALALCVPTLLVWLFAWGIGAEFQLGTDAVHSLTAAPTTPIPAIPILAAVPNGTPGLAWIALPVVLAILAGCWQYSGFGRLDFAAHLKVAATFTVVSAAGVALAIWAAGGALGPGRMQFLGTHTAGVFAMYLAVIALPLAIVFVILHPRVRGLVTGRRHLSQPDPQKVGQVAPDADKTETTALLIDPTEGKDDE